MKQHIIAVAIVAMSCATTAFAQTDRTSSLSNAEQNGWEYEVKAGVNIGGASPLPMPVEIRKISSYSPKFNGTLEGTVTKWLGKEQKWRVAGYWTGYVKTNYNTTLLTIPVMANYRFNDRWKVRAGLYSSIKLDGQFTGNVSEGYLREGTPMGEKLTFADGNTASYDFSSNLRHFQWGGQLGATWRAFNHFTVNADLTWAFNNIFESDFKTISFGLYPIYLNLGFGYRF